MVICTEEKDSFDASKVSEKRGYHIVGSSLRVKARGTSGEVGVFALRDGELISSVDEAQRAENTERCEPDTQHSPQQDRKDGNQHDLPLEVIWQARCLREPPSYKVVKPRPRLEQEDRAVKGSLAARLVAEQKKPPPHFVDRIQTTPTV